MINFNKSESFCINEINEKNKEVVFSILRKLEFVWNGDDNLNENIFDVRSYDCLNYLKKEQGLRKGFYKELINLNSLNKEELQNTISGNNFIHLFPSIIEQLKLNDENFSKEFLEKIKTNPIAYRIYTLYSSGEFNLFQLVEHLTNILIEHDEINKRNF